MAVSATLAEENIPLAVFIRYISCLLSLKSNAGAKPVWREVLALVKIT
jgi:hypothetical protein